MPIAETISKVSFSLYEGSATKDALNLFCVVCGIFARNVAASEVTGLRKSHASLHQELKGKMNAWKAETYQSKVIYASDLRAE